MSTDHLRINLKRLKDRLNRINEIGALDGGGVKRLALSDEDRDVRNLLREMAEEYGYQVSVDEIGNMFISRDNPDNRPCIMTGSHLDTVGTGGYFDGPLGVLAGLEVLNVLDEAGIQTSRPVVVANFTNEEGVRFMPDMMGSLAFKKGMSIADLYRVISTDGTVQLGEELERIGYKGNMKTGSIPVSHFLELHIEQGPVLEKEELDIAAVTRVQGIFWTEYIIEGRAAHAGTTPIPLREDAGYVAAELNTFIRRTALDNGGAGTVGIQEISPNLINVVPESVRITTDLRHPDAGKLTAFQEQADAYLKEVANREGCRIQREEKVRFMPVEFSEDMVSSVLNAAEKLGYSSRKMISGAGHDAQMMAAVCPASMIFVPSVDGISHNIEEFTRDEDLEKGANVLLHSILSLSN